MRFALIVSFLLSFLTLNAQTIQGKVVRVSDGDTITILDEGKVENKIRLNRIDAPEKKQAFGEVSRKSLVNMVAGTFVVDAMRQEVILRHRQMFVWRLPKSSKIVEGHSR